MTDNELLHVIYDGMQTMKSDLRTVKQEIGELKQNVEILNQDVGELKQNVEILNQDVEYMKKQAVDMQVTDNAILDEVERVHEILERHLENKAMYTA